MSGISETNKLRGSGREERKSEEGGSGREGERRERREERRGRGRGRGRETAPTFKIITRGIQRNGTYLLINQIRSLEVYGCHQTNLTIFNR
jgi:hypothetical protein